MRHTPEYLRAKPWWRIATSAGPDYVGRHRLSQHWGWMRTYGVRFRVNTARGGAHG